MVGTHNASIKVKLKLIFNIYLYNIKLLYFTIIALSECLNDHLFCP